MWLLRNLKPVEKPPNLKKHIVDLSKYVFILTYQNQMPVSSFHDNSRFRLIRGRSSDLFEPIRVQSSLITNNVGYRMEMQGDVVLAAIGQHLPDLLLSQ